MVWGMNEKKRSFRRVRERITGKGAKAVFHRQMLEYRKEKFFFLDKLTLVSLFIAVCFSFGFGKDAVGSSEAPIVLLGVVAYVSFCMSGYLGKWETELKNPYIFMIPDTPLRKMWYATLTEHIKAVINGTVICLPIGLYWRVPVWKIIFCILIYVVIQANRLYTMVITHYLVGETFGKTGQNVIRMCIQMMLLGTGAGVAALAAVFINMDLIFPIVLVYSMIVTVVTGVAASFRFEMMEQL